MRRLLVIGVVTGAVVLVAMPPASGGAPTAEAGTEPPVVTEIPVGQLVDQPTGITAGPDGRMWFVGTGNDMIGRVAPGDPSVEADPTSGVSQPWAITAGGDGNLWITGVGNDSVGRVDPADGSVDAFALTGLDDPRSIVAGPDGNVWVAGRSNDTLARVTPAGVVTVFDLPAGTGPAGLTVGGDGHLWVTGEDADTLVVVDPADGVVLAAHPSAVPSPRAVVTLPDGDLWVLGSGPSQTMAAVAVPSGTMTTYATPFPLRMATVGLDGAVYAASGDGAFAHVDPATGSVTDRTNGWAAQPYRAMATSPDGNLWITSGLYWYYEVIVREPGGDRADSYINPGEGLCEARDLVPGPDDDLWASGGRAIARLDPTGEVTTVHPLPAGVGGAGELTLGGDGRLWLDAAGAAGLSRATTEGVWDDVAVQPLALGDMAAGPDGTTWIADRFDRVYRVDTADTVTSWPTYASGVDEPTALVRGPDGHMWMTSRQNDRVARIDPVTGAITAYSVGALDGPFDLAFGPDGKLWVIGIMNDLVARFDPTTGTVTGVFPAGVDAPSAIVAGADGNLWVVGLYGGLTRLTTTGDATTFPLTGGIHDQVDEIVVGPDDNLWVPGPKCNVRRIAIATPGVSITKEALESSVVAGDDVTWELTVANTGDVGLTEVTVSDPAAPDCERTVGDLGPGASTTFRCTSATNDADVGLLTNHATVQAEPDLGLAVSATDDAEVQVEARPHDLALTKALESSDGTEATFRLTVENLGPGPAPGPVVVVDTMPTGLAYQDAVGDGFSCTATRDEVTCTRADGLDPGATASVLVTTAVDAGHGTVVNQAELPGDDADPGNDRASASIDTGEPSTTTTSTPSPTTSTTPAPTVAGRPGLLARTGAEIGPLGGLGLALLALGALAMAASARVRRA